MEWVTLKFLSFARKSLSVQWWKGYQHRKLKFISCFFGFLIALVAALPAAAYSPEGVYMIPINQPLVSLPLPERNPRRGKLLTLQDAILLALRTNPNIRSAEIQRVADKFALEVAHNRYEPQYSFTSNITWARGTRPQYVFTPQVSLLTPLGTQVQVQMNQSLLGGGDNGSSVTATITQPLLQGFGPKITMSPLLQAEYAENNARLNLKNTIITNITDVITAYYTLVQSQNNLITDELALDSSLTLLKQFRIRIQAGQAAPLEIAPLESQVASQRLTITQDKNTIQQNYQALLIVLGLDPHSDLHVDPNIRIDSFALPSLEKSTALAIENNILYQQAIYAVKNAQITVMQQQDLQRWQLNLVAQKVFVPNPPPGISQNAGDNVQLQLTIPINNKQLQQGLVDAKVSLEQQKIALSQAKLTTQSQVLNAFQSLTYQTQQIKQAEDQVTYAKIAYDAEIKKLEYGRTTMVNVTNLRDSLTQAQLALISQKINYINSLAAFEALLGITLEKWSIELYY